MTTKKRNASLSALETGLANEASQQEAEREKSLPSSFEPTQPSNPPQKKKKIQLPTYPPVLVHEQLRRLAFEEHTSINALTLEAWDLLFRQRGLKSIEVLTREDQGDSG